MAPDDAAPRTRVEATVAAVRDDIIRGDLQPGAKLAVEHLRQRYGVGSSTIREALSLLLPDGLVTAQGQRGFAVAPISVADLVDLSEMRVLLETQALRESITKGDDAWEAGVVAAFHRLSRAQENLEAGEPDAAAEWEVRNHRFHDALTASCDSPWIHRVLNMLHHHSERYRRFALTDRSIPRDVHAEHHALMQAALDRDVDEACTIATLHIQRTTEVIAALYGRSIDADPAGDPVDPADPPDDAGHPDDAADAADAGQVAR